MKPLPSFSPEFIGRREAINAFYSLRTLREQKNVLYVKADGGLGKTWLLQEYIRHCQNQRRHWHTGPEDMSFELRIIDFYNLENRTVDGLRRSIVRRIGLEHFPNFLDADNQLQTEKDTAHLAELRRDTEYWFFQEFKRALREMGTYTALFFDTFEVVHNRRVGRWFLEEFLPSRAVTGCMIVFAGRPSPFDIPQNVLTYDLRPFTEDEALDYFQKKWNIHSEEPESKVIRACQGKPLLLDLTVHYARMLEGSIEDLIELPEEQFENRLVARFTQQPDFLSEIIRSMAYLKRRYNRGIYEYQNEGAEASYDEIERQLHNLPFIKYRPSEHTLTLHDEFQRMIAEYGGPDWRALADDLYGRIVRGWYDQVIPSVKGTNQYLLQAEQLAYILERDFQGGLALYQQYFEQIKKRLLFDLNDMLWGEVAALLGDDHQAYELMLGQANWLFEFGRPADSAFWFEQLASSRFAKVRDPHSHTRVRIRLGHSHLQLGEADEAGTIWEKALGEAQSKGNGEDISAFSYNLGHVRRRQGQWEEALKLYEVAIQQARSSLEKETRDFMGEALFVTARLRARQADLEQALQELRTGLQITERSQHAKGGQIRYAQALSYAGDVHRYLSDLLTSQGYYRHAWELLSSMDGWFNWKILVLAGLGAVSNLSGKSKRENGRDIEGDIQDQQKSLEYFQHSLQIAREHDTESRLHQVFDRMGDLYLELHILDGITRGTPFEESTQALISQAGTLSLPEERIWQFRLREPNQTFETLDLLGRAQRLFDLALLQADKFGEHHYMFDSLAQASSVAQQRGRESDLEYYATLASTLHGLDDPQQERLFLSYLALLNAHMAFNTDQRMGIEHYASAALQVMGGGIFGRYLIQQQLPAIQNNLLSLPKDEANQFCDFLSKEWAENKHLNNFIQGVKDQLLFFD
jgi:hypothetical protein